MIVYIVNIIFLVFSLIEDHVSKIVAGVSFFLFLFFSYLSQKIFHTGLLLAHIKRFSGHPSVELFFLNE